MQNDFLREGAPQEVPQARLVIGTIAALIVAFKPAVPIVVTVDPYGVRGVALAASLPAAWH
jgi:hypothetical protein